MEESLACVRARGCLNVEAAMRDGRSVRTDVHESGAIRVRFPREHFARLDATIVNVAGGMTGGDHFDMKFTAKAGAQLFVSSAAAEKIYRSTGQAARVSAQLAAEAGAFCVWLPQETIIFNNANLVRTLEADIACGARFIACEMTILGRAAMGEIIDDIAWRERWRIRRDGKLVVAEDLRMDGDAAAHFRRKSTGAGAHAFATLVYLGEKAEAVCARMRDNLDAQESVCESGVTAFDDIVIVRFAAQDGQSLRASVVKCLGAIDGLALPRGWYT